MVFCPLINLVNRQPVTQGVRYPRDNVRDMVVA